MKNILKQLSMSLLAGIVFGVGALAFLLLSDHFVAQKDEKNNLYIEVPNPTDILISDHWINTKTTKLTIHGIIENKSNKTYAYIYSTAYIFADKAQIGKCETTIYRIKPATSKAMLFECDNIEASGLPKNINYNIKITNATQYRDKT